MNIRKIAKDWLPPILYGSLAHLTKSSIQFEGNYSSWEEAHSQCSGYDSENILNKVLDATLKVKNDEAVFERDSVLFYESEYVWPVLSGLLLAAAQNQGKLNVLDFGGALGSTYFQHQRILKSLPEIKWNIIEQDGYVKAGKQYIEDEHLRFYSEIEGCVLHNNVNVALLSSVLQYIENPTKLLGDIAALKIKLIIMDRTCYTNKKNSSSIKIQVTPSTIYKAKYPCRFFDEEEIINQLARANYTLLKDFESLDKLDKSATWKGHIYVYNG